MLYPGYILSSHLVGVAIGGAIDLFIGITVGYEIGYIQLGGDGLELLLARRRLANDEDTGIHLQDPSQLADDVGILQTDHSLVEGLDGGIGLLTVHGHDLGDERVLADHSQNSTGRERSTPLEGNKLFSK